jgi:hypothetical protein
MPQAHATNGSGAPQSQSHSETISTVSASSAPWLAAGISKATYYRRRQSANNPSPELNGGLNPESKLNGEIPQPNGNGNIESELKLNPEIPAEEKPTAGEYQEKVISEADAATERLRQQLKALEQSQELSRRREQQANEAAQQVNQVFAFWRQAGLSPDQQKILAANPAAMIQLTDFAARQAAELGHQIGSPEYIEAAKRSFFENLERLQARQAAPAEPTPTTNQHEPAMQSKFFEPVPPAQPQRPSRAPSLYSAPVSREVSPGRSQFDDKVTLSVAEQEAAKIAGVDLATYAREKRRYQILKAQGQVE